ncbi:unnamed protein product [Urochloa humidicola]
MNELRGGLHITNLEAVTRKEEAVGAALHQKRHLEDLRLIWTEENGSRTENALHLEVLEGLMPPPQLNGLKIEGLPDDIRILRHCLYLTLDNVPNLKTLPCLPAGLKKLSISQCPLLMFITDDELQKRGQRENPMRSDHLVSQLALLWEVDSGSNIRSVLSDEHSSLKQLMTLMDHDVSEHLETIKSFVEKGRDEVLAKKSIINAWLSCHEQRIELIYGRSIGLPLVPPTGLSELYLSSCSITDGALASCLGGLTSLYSLSLKRIMDLTALPSEESWHVEQNICLCPLGHSTYETAFLLLIH